MPAASFRISVVDELHHQCSFYAGQASPFAQQVAKTQLGALPGKIRFKPLECSPRREIKHQPRITLFSRASRKAAEWA